LGFTLQRFAPFKDRSLFRVPLLSCRLLDGIRFRRTPTWYDFRALLPLKSPALDVRFLGDHQSLSSPGLSHLWGFRPFDPSDPFGPSPLLRFPDPTLPSKQRRSRVFLPKGRFDLSETSQPLWCLEPSRFSSPFGVALDAGLCFSPRRSDNITAVLFVS
jgi:hypothetical protein